MSSLRFFVPLAKSFMALWMTSFNGVWEQLDVELLLVRALWYTWWLELDFVGYGDIWSAFWWHFSFDLWCPLLLRAQQVFWRELEGKVVWGSSVFEAAWWTIWVHAFATLWSKTKGSLEWYLYTSTFRGVPLQHQHMCCFKECHYATR